LRNGKISTERQLFRGFVGLRDVRYLLRESRGHLAIAVAFGDFHTLIQLFERPRDLSFAEKHTNLSKDAGVERSFFSGVHDGCDTILDGRITLIQPRHGYRFSVEAILLGRFAHLRILARYDGPI